MSQGGRRRDNIRRVTHAVVLIRAEREALPTLGGTLADIEGVAEAYSVTGEWDFVAIVRVAATDDLARIVTERLPAGPGVAGPHSMVGVPGDPPPGPQAVFS